MSFINVRRIFVSRAQRAVEKIIALTQNITSIEFVVLCISLGSHRSFCVTGLGETRHEKIAFASVAAATLIATNAASAADMGLPVKGRALEPEWNWSGFYAGLNVGYARGTDGVERFGWRVENAGG